MLWEVGGRPFLMKGSEKKGEKKDLVRRVKLISTSSTACSGIFTYCKSSTVGSGFV